MGWRVIEEFSDMQDGGYTYKPGDSFPRFGVGVVNAERIRALSTKDNALGRPVIAMPVDEELPKTEKTVEVEVEKEPEPEIVKPKRSRKNKE